MTIVADWMGVDSSRDSSDTFLPQVAEPEWHGPLWIFLRVACLQ